MELRYVLSLYFLIFIVLFLILYCFGLTSCSAFIISLIISQVILLLMVNHYDIDTEANYSDLAIYTFIQIATVICVYLFAILCILSKGNNPNSVCVINNSCC